MTVSVESSIAVAIVKAPLRLTFTASSGNFVRVWCTAAPPGSKLRGKLDTNGASRVHVASTDSGKAFDYTFDIAGAYQLAATELTEGAAPYGGGYEGAPDADRSEVILGETALTFYVASALKATVGQGQDTAELVLYVANDMIQETTLAVHGVATPAVQKPKTGKARTATEGAVLINRLNDLVGVTASSALGDLAAVITDAIDKFNLHAGNATWHDAADNDNQIADAFRNPTSPEALKRSISALLKSLSAHVRNDSIETPEGTGSAAWHSHVDWVAIPLFESSASVTEHLRALADAWRVFEAHRVSSAAHDTPDTTNGLTTLPTLLDVHRLFLTQLASLSPTVPNTENSAKTILVHGAGFEEN